MLSHISYKIYESMVQHIFAESRYVSHADKELKQN